MQLSTILDQIDLGSMALPVFQRGYVWSRDHVRALMRSLYRGYPVGSLLVWETKTANTEARGEMTPPYDTVKMLLDGQQRITTLYGIIRGKPPAFFDGDTKAFTNLYFNIEDQEFEFYAPKKMTNNPLWVNVTDLMQNGVIKFLTPLNQSPHQANLETYLNRLNTISNIRQRDFHIENVSGDDKNIDVVVDIFNVVNSGGKKLKQSDLALARVGAVWPEARDAMKNRLSRWEKAGFRFELDWLMRTVTTTLTGEPFFGKIRDFGKADFENGLRRTERHIDNLLNLIAGRLGLDHDRVLGGAASFPLLTRYLEQRNGKIIDPAERDKLLYWYVHSFLWGHYASGVESTLATDLAFVERQGDAALDFLIDGLRQNRGDLRLNARDFDTATKGSRFYPLLYMLTRVCHAKDWESGIDLTAHLLGKLNVLQVHHIFPAALLRKSKVPDRQINAIANFTFLTQVTNLSISDKRPEIYLEEVAMRYPEALPSHWIPMDRALWKVENYPHFLAARRELLAQAANEFLDSLWQGTTPEAMTVGSILERETVVVHGNIEDEEEERVLQECNGWVIQQGLAPGEMQYELADPVTRAPLAVLDLTWPDGMQTGTSSPIAFLLNEQAEMINLVQHGFICFTNLDALKAYVETNLLGE